MLTDVDTFFQRPDLFDCILINAGWCANCVFFFLTKINNLQNDFDENFEILRETTNKTNENLLNGKNFNNFYIVCVSRSRKKIVLIFQINILS